MVNKKLETVAVSFVKKYLNAFQVCRFVKLPQTPNTFSNQITTTITTTAFKIALIVPCIGIYLLISHSTTPTAIRTRIIVIIGIISNVFNMLVFRFIALKTLIIPTKQVKLPVAGVMYLINHNEQVLQTTIFLQQIFPILQEPLTRII